MCAGAPRGAAETPRPGANACPSLSPVNSEPLAPYGTMAPARSRSTLMSDGIGVMSNDDSQGRRHGAAILSPRRE